MGGERYAGCWLDVCSCRMTQRKVEESEGGWNGSGGMMVQVLVVQ